MKKIFLKIVIGVVSAFMFLIACFLIAIYYIIRINLKSPRAALKHYSTSSR